MTTKSISIGVLLKRKRDGAFFRVAETTLAVPSQAHPGPWGKRVYTLRPMAGGYDCVGSVSWVRTYFDRVDERGQA